MLKVKMIRNQMKHIFPALRVIVVALLAGSVLSCSRVPELSINETLFFDLEEISADSNFFVSNTHPRKMISGIERIANDKARSGNNSVMVREGRQHALTCMIENTNSDEYYVASVWRKGPPGQGFLVVSDDHNAIFYKQVNVAESTGEDGWERLQLAFYIPQAFKNVCLKFYVWNPGRDTVYFDDLSISRKAHQQYPVYRDISDLKIYLDTMESRKLQHKREEAFKKGILETSDDDWVKGMLFNEENLYKADIRLKGDWLDHLLGRKWSFRIKLKKGNTWNGMRTFSVQNPRSRDFLNEWLLHQFCHQEDILATRYGFIPLIYNNSSLGIYAWEEHFEKYLVESNKRREGPILKVNENALWKVQQIARRDNKKYWLPIVSAAEIIPFKYSRTTGDPGLLEQFRIGQELYHQYKYASKPPSSIFDLDKLARYCAMIDLFGTYHGITWHNQRFYYNPVIAKLEPIAFDNFGEEGAVRYIHNAILGNYYINFEKVSDNDILLIGLLRDPDFLHAYVHYLEKYSQEEFISELMHDHRSELEYYDSLLRIEYPSYRFDYEYLHKNARNIREELPDFIENCKSPKAGMPVFRNPDPVYSTGMQPEISTYFVKAYSVPGPDNTLHVNVENHFTTAVNILGTAKNDKGIRDFIYPEEHVLANAGRQPGKAVVMAAAETAYLYYMVEGDLETYHIPVYPWPSPGKRMPPQQMLLKEHGDNYLDYFTEQKEGELFINEGTYVIREPIVIPGGYKVNIKPGVVINLVDKAPFISYSPVFAHGTESRPIHVKSSDGTGNGFTVLQAGERSSLLYVVFDRLNTLDIDGWTLTGAVTFYESAVDCYQTVFQNNVCEDGLNIIRSEFTIDQCRVEHTFADALDVDFGVGSITATEFRYLSNDAIDVSGSDIMIRACIISQSNDKGISGGENSRVEVWDTQIKGSEIGIASKDQSDVLVADCIIEDCNYGLLVFRKKAEFGPARITAEGLVMSGISTDFLVERNSYCLVNGRIISADAENVYDIFYP